MDIREIAERINEKARDYQMGTFQQLRKEIHNLGRMPTRKIFANKSIKNDDNEQYAFHYGGRTELQYNIGFVEDGDDELFRYGVALSFKKSYALIEYTILEPQFIRLNEYIKFNKPNLDDYRLFYHDNNNDYSFLPMNEIDNDKFDEGYFIFFGKTILKDKIDFNEILNTFDWLLDVYKYVETECELTEINTEISNEFKFEPGISQRVESSLRKTEAKKREVNLRHNQIQGKIGNILIKKYGKDHVSTENKTGLGTRIDIVVERTSERIFYEIKTHSDIRYCIRSALGQLTEYAFWPKPRDPTKLVIISENKITDNAKKYLQFIRKTMGLNIYYQQFDFDKNKLFDEY